MNHTESRHAVRLMPDELQEINISASGKTFVVRTPTAGAAGKAIQAAGVGLGPAIRLQ